MILPRRATMLYSSARGIKRVSQELREDSLPEHWIEYDGSSRDYIGSVGLRETGPLWAKHTI